MSFELPTDRRAGRRKQLDWKPDFTSVLDEDNFWRNRR